MDIYLQVFFGYKWSNLGIYITDMMSTGPLVQKNIPIGYDLRQYQPYTNTRFIPPIYQAKRPNTSMGLVWKWFEVQKQHLPHMKETKILPYQDQDQSVMFNNPEVVHRP
jgi:hypothetical protein